MPNRTEKRLLKVLDELQALAEQRRLVAAELELHTHINDDAQRDAALGIDRLEATATRNEVIRFMRLLDDMESRRKRLEEVRAKLVHNLGG